MRVVNRVLAAVLALALLVGGVLLAVEIVVAAFGRDPWVVPHDRWYRNTLGHSWDDDASRWVFIGLVLAGLALLALQIVRRRPGTLPLSTGGAPADLGRRSMERSLVRAATSVDGVSGAKVRVSAERADVVATTSRRLAEEVRPHLAEAVERRVRALGLAREPQVKVQISGRNGAGGGDG